MSSQDLVDIFGSDVAVIQNEDRVASSGLNLGTKESGVNNSSTPVQKDSPGNMLFDFSDESTFDNSGSSLYEDTTKQPAVLDRPANTDDLLGISNNTELVETKASNSSVDLLGGFTQMNSKTELEVESISSNIVGLGVTGDGNERIDTHIMGDKDTPTPSMSLVDFHELGSPVSTELSAELLPEQTLNSQVEYGKTSHSGGMLLDTSLSGDTETAAEDLPLTEVTNINLTCAMKNPIIIQSTETVLEDGESKSHARNNEDAKDILSSLGLSASESTMSQTKEFACRNETENTTQEIMPQMLIHEQVQPDPQSHSSVAVRIEEENALKLENEDLLGLSLASTMSQAQQPTFTPAKSVINDVTAPHNLVAFEDFILDTKNDEKDHIVGDNKIFGEVTASPPGGIPTMTENLPMTNDQSIMCIAASTSPATGLQEAVDNDHVHTRGSNHSDAMLLLNSEQQNSFGTDPAKIHASKQDGLIDSNRSVNDLLVSLGALQDTNETTRTDQSSESISASFIEQIDKNGVQKILQEDVDNGEASNSDGETGNLVTIAGKGLSSIGESLTVDSQTITGNASPRGVGEMSNSNAFHNVKSETRTLLPDLLDVTTGTSKKEYNDDLLQQLMQDDSPDKPNASNVSGNLVDLQPSAQENFENVIDTSDDKQKIDGDLLFQDDTSLNTFEKSDTIIHDTLENFNDISTPTVENGMIMFPFQEAVSKHTLREGENIISLPDTTTGNISSDTMSGNFSEADVSDVVEELIQKVYQGDAIDLGICKDGNINVEEVEFQETLQKEDQMSQHSIEERKAESVGGCQSARDSRKIESQQTTTHEYTAISSFSKSHIETGGHVSSIFTVDGKHNLSGTSSGEEDYCDNTPIFKQSTVIPDKMLQNEHETGKNTASVDLILDDLAENTAILKESTQIILRNDGCSSSIDEQLMETDQMPSTMGSAVEIHPKQSSKVDIDLNDLDMPSISSNDDVQVPVPNHNIMQHSPDGENNTFKKITSRGIQSIGAELLIGNSEDSPDHDLDQLTVEELAVAQETDAAKYDITPNTQSDVGFKRDFIAGLQMEDSPIGDISGVTDFFNHSTQVADEYAIQTTSDHGGDQIDTAPTDMPVTLTAATIADGLLNEIICSATNEVKEDASLCSSASLIEASEAQPQVHTLNVSASFTVETSGLQPGNSQILKNDLESIDTNVDVISQAGGNEEESLPVVPVRKKKKKVSLNESVESMASVLESHEQEKAQHDQVQVPTFDNEPATIIEKVGEEDESVSNLIEGPIAAQLVKRLVNDVICNAISIVEDDVISETDDITISSTSFTDSLIYDDSINDFFQNKEMIGIDTMEPWVEEVCSKPSANATGAAFTDVSLDTALDDEKMPPPQIPVRKKKKQLSHDPQLDLETIEVKEYQSEPSEDAPIDLKQSGCILSKTTVSQFTTAESNNSSESSNHTHLSNNVSSSLSGTAPGHSPLALLIGEASAEDSNVNSEIDSKMLPGPILDIYDGKDHCAATISVTHVTESANELSTAKEQHETIPNENLEELVPDSSGESETPNLPGPKVTNMQSDKSIYDQYKDPDFSDIISPLARDHVAEMCVTGVPSLKINDNQPSAGKDELSTAFINNAKNEEVGVGRLIGTTMCHLQKKSVYGEVHELDASSSSEVELMTENYDLLENSEEVGRCTSQNPTISNLGLDAGKVESGVTKVKTSQPGKIEINDENDTYKKRHDPAPDIDDSPSERQDSEITPGEDDSEDDLNGDKHLELELSCPPPLPEADYEDMDFDELPRSKSDTALGDEYFDEGYYTGGSYKATTNVGTGVSLPSSFIKKSVSLPASYYSNFSATIPSTVFIEKDLLSDNDESDAESVKSTTSNDDNVADNDNSISNTVMNTFFLNQYRNTSSDPAGPPLLGFDPQSSYQAYDNDWEDIVTEPLRRFSGLPVILEESETSEVDESESLQESDQESDNCSSDDPVDEIVEIPSLSYSNQASDFSITGEDITNSEEIPDQLDLDTTLSEKVTDAESFEIGSDLTAAASNSSLITQIESAIPKSPDKSHFTENENNFDDFQLPNDANVASIGLISNQKSVEGHKLGVHDLNTNLQLGIQCVTDESYDEIPTETLDEVCDSEVVASLQENSGQVPLQLDALTVSNILEEDVPILIMSTKLSPDIEESNEEVLDSLQNSSVEVHPWQDMSLEHYESLSVSKDSSRLEGKTLEADTDSQCSEIPGEALASTHYPDKLLLEPMTSTGHPETIVVSQSQMAFNGSFEPYIANDDNKTNITHSLTPEVSDIEVVASSQDNGGQVPLQQDALTDSNILEEDVPILIVSTELSPDIEESNEKALHSLENSSGEVHPQQDMPLEHYESLAVNKDSNGLEGKTLEIDTDSQCSEIPGEALASTHYPDKLLLEPMTSTSHPETIAVSQSQMALNDSIEPYIANDDNKTRKNENPDINMNIAHSPVSEESDAVAAASLLYNCGQVPLQHDALVGSTMLEKDAPVIIMTTEHSPALKESNEEIMDTLQDSSAEVHPQQDESNSESIAVNENTTRLEGKTPETNTAFEFFLISGEASASIDLANKALVVSEDSHEMMSLEAGMNVEYPQVAKECDYEAKSYTNDSADHVPQLQDKLATYSELSIVNEDNEMLQEKSVKTLIEVELPQYSKDCYDERLASTQSPIQPNAYSDLGPTVVSEDDHIGVDLNPENTSNSEHEGMPEANCNETSCLRMFPEVIASTDSSELTASSENIPRTLQESNLDINPTDEDSQINKEHLDIVSALHNNTPLFPLQNSWTDISEPTARAAPEEKEWKENYLEAGVNTDYPEDTKEDLDGTNELVAQHTALTASAKLSAINTDSLVLADEDPGFKFSSEQSPAAEEVCHEAVTSLHDNIQAILPQPITSTDLSESVEEVGRPPSNIKEHQNVSSLTVSENISEGNSEDNKDQYILSASSHDTSGLESVQFPYEFTEVAVTTICSNEVNDIVIRSSSDNLTEPNSTNLKEIANNVNANTAKVMDTLNEELLSPGNENVESPSQEVRLSDGKTVPMTGAGDVKVADSSMFQKIGVQASLVSTGAERLYNDNGSVGTESIDDKPPPPPSRKKKKAKQMQAANVYQIEVDQIKKIPPSKNNPTISQIGDPELSENSVSGSELKVDCINNETPHYEQEQVEHPSSIIDDHAKAKQVPEAGFKNNEITHIDTTIEKSTVTTALIMADEVTSGERQRYCDSQDSVEQNSEARSKDMNHSQTLGIISLQSEIEPTPMGNNATEAVTPTDLPVEKEFKSEELGIGSLQKLSNLSCSFENLEEGNKSLLNDDAVCPTPSSTPTEELIASNSGLKENISLDFNNAAEHYAQEIMKEALLFPLDASTQAMAAGDSSSDAYSSSENEYEVNQDDERENAVALSDNLEYFHIIADKVVSSIMSSLVTSVEAIVIEVPSLSVNEGGNEKTMFQSDELHVAEVNKNEETAKKYDASEEVSTYKGDEETKLLEITEDENTYQTAATELQEIKAIDNKAPHSKKGIKRQRFDTTGSIRYLTDSEDEDADEKGKPNRLISLDDDIFEDDLADSPHSASQDSDEENSLVAKRKSLVPPSSLVLSVALDEIDLRDNSDVQETPVSQRISLSSSLTSSQTSLASSGGEVAGNKRSMLPRLPSLRLKRSTTPVVPEVIKTKYHYVDPEEIIPIVPMPDLKRVIKWENVTIRNIEYQIDEAVVQPYKKVIAHGGFYDAKSTIIEIFLPYLPSSNIQHYDWIMDNLFLYVLATVELLAQGNFSVVIFVGPKSHIPANALLRRWHQHVEYRLKKNVEAFYIVNPTFYFKTMARLFVSRKVSKKMKYVKSLAELGTYIPTDFLFVPPEIAT